MKVFFALLLAVISIASSSAEDETYLWGEQTPIYTVTKIGETLKIKVSRDNFWGEKANNSGNPNALFPKILIFTDHLNFQKKHPELESLAKDVIRSINANLSMIKSNRPVEALMAGIVVMRDPGIYDGSPTGSIVDIGIERNSLLTQKYKVERVVPIAFSKWYREESYRRATKELKAFSDWMREHRDQFEDLHAHIYLLLSKTWLVDDTADLKKARLVMGLRDSSEEICNSKPSVVVTDSIGNFNEIYAMAISYAMGLTDSRDKTDFPYYTGSFHISDSKRREWQNKFAEVVNDMDRDNKYACFRDDDYDD